MTNTMETHMTKRRANAAPTYIDLGPGIIRDGTLLNVDKDTGNVTKKLGIDKWQPVIDIDLTGTFLTLRDAAEAMVNGGWDGRGR